MPLSKHHVPDYFRRNNADKIRRDLQIKKVMDESADLQQVVYNVHGFLIQDEQYKKREEASAVTEEEVEEELRESWAVEVDDAQDTIDEEMGEEMEVVMAVSSSNPDATLTQILHHCSIPPSGRFIHEGISYELRSTHYAVQTSQFKRWLTYNHTSSSLLVDDNNSQVALGSLSPAYSLSQSLLHLFHHSHSIITLSVLCNYYPIADSPPHRAAKIVKSLISQLLTQPSELKLDFQVYDITEEKLSSIEGNDLDELCDTFKYLVKQIPHTKMLVCCLNMVSTFEISETLQEDMTKVLKLLTGLISSELSLTIKLLLTVNNGSKMIVPTARPGLVKVDYIITTPRDVSEAGPSSG